MTEDVALVLLPSVLYRSAQLLDMKRITDVAKERGIYRMGPMSLYWCCTS